MFANALGYAVKLRLLPFNPLDRIQWKASAVAETIDRLSAADPAQVGGRARGLVPGPQWPGARSRRRGGRLLRRDAARHSRGSRRTLPCALARGRIDLVVSAPRTGTEWADDGASREQSGLKHRAAKRPAASPYAQVLVRMLRAHIAPYGTGPGGRLFHTDRGGPLNDTGHFKAWHRARTLAQQDYRWPARPTTCATPPSPCG